MHDLAPYAVSDLNSAGRHVKEPAPAGRSEFQRDRDRIIHSTAFRRLEYKTQVFVNHEGDLFRTRLTHSLEVAQIGRSIARNLKINEDLVEAVALAHDLGHTPFGHAGQTALNICMEPYGGFEHNQQSLRVVDILEERYAEFDGLNLCLETRAGILKHCTTEKAKGLGEVAVRFLSNQQPSLEAQIGNLADEIAYNNHDVDDGLRAGLISVTDLCQVSVFARHFNEVNSLYPGLNERRTIHETVRRMINTLIADVINQSMANIKSSGVAHPDDVRSNPPLIRFSREIEHEQHELKRFLHRHLYRHYRVLRMGEKADHVIRRLFEAFMGNTGLLPPQYQDKTCQDGSRTIADYIAGMTDRYATREYRRLFAIEEF